MYNKVDSKKKENMLNSTFRPTYIFLFILSLIFITIVNCNLAKGIGIKFKEVKSANEVNSNKTVDAIYKVIHKYEQLDGTYSNEEKILSGTIDTEVTPDIISKEGYIDPNLQTVKISKENNTVVEYIYELKSYDLEVLDYDKVVEGNISGKYKYGTEIKLSSKSIPGYKFIKWTNNSKDKNIILVIKESITIGPKYEKIEETKEEPKKEEPKEEKKTIIYTVKYDAGEGKLTNNIVKIEKGNSISKLPKPTPNTKFETFKGWYTSKKGGTKVNDGYKPSSDITLYARYDDECYSFKNDTWDTVAHNVYSNVGYYPLGCERVVKLDLNNDGAYDKTTKVRVVNNTLTDACYGKNQPVMACGFVIEFVDIIERGNISRINQLHVDLQRTFSDVYIYEFSTTGLYGTRNNNIEETTNTKQLDYYKNLGVTRTNSSSTIKKYNGKNSDWLIVSKNNDNTYLYNVNTNGTLTNKPYNFETIFGISPGIRFYDKYSLPHACTVECSHTL